jgi:hypothetical protein
MSGRLVLRGDGATSLLMDQYLTPESDVPNRSQSELAPDATVPQLARPGVAPEPQGPTLNAGSRVGIARVVVPASIAEGPLDAVERHLGRRQDNARKSERENRDNVAEAAESVLNRVVVGVVDMLDLEQLIDHVPINKVVARVDLPGVIDEIDLAGVIRESTTGLGAETLDASRAGLMAIDLWSARLVDKILLRKGPRDLATQWNDAAPPESANHEAIS